MDFEKFVLNLIRRAQTEGKVFETRKIEFKQLYALQNENGKINKAVQAEFIRDVMSLANSLPDPELDTGLLILGVTKTGTIVDNYTLPIADISNLPQIINGSLERPISFSYREYEYGQKKVGVIIIPKSSSTPYIVKNELSENGNIHLRPGECWTRAEGGKKLAMASDFDEIYEYRAGVNKFQSAKSRKKLSQSVKQKKQSKVTEVLELDNENLNEYIKKLLNR